MGRWFRGGLRDEEPEAEKMESEEEMAKGTEKDPPTET